ncbi:hypothetical protein HPP92_028647 [Vanilla planifolia]|uniref:Uncharacterized protein n=1 Tax=Vanilla planifolia TaxID=51239 RepID=A0A835U2B3_VANPL|nr:hypothetical protein HPP92_028647 [Vanilla planifolia]KAG0446874.1 hypothetical protein HPP92_028641 [Vanilla planifolia]
MNKGILVWKLDNRGTSRRGLKFESFLKHNIGCVDAEDQFTACEGFPTPSRVCAVSGPRLCMDGYDTFYTEKYLGLLLENSDAYDSRLHHAPCSQSKGKAAPHPWHDR